MNKPEISIIIPVYNSPELLVQAIDSVLSQRYPNFELLIIDDGSEVDLMDYISLFDDPRINYYKLKHSNANVARNYGMQISKGKYIAMLDSDDLWLESHLDQCLNSIDVFDGLYGSIIVRSNDSNEDYIYYTRELDQGESMINFLLNTCKGAQTSTLFMTASSAKDIKWTPTLKRHQDYDFVLRYSKKYKWGVIDTPTIIYS